MRKILIVGSGQSGLQLALGLLQYGYNVTVMSTRTADEIRNGRVMSTQAMFSDALQCERDLGLNFWENETPPMGGIWFSVAGSDGDRAIDWVGRFNATSLAVDQRIKMADWMELFEDRGGKVIIHGVTVSDLDRFSNLFDLVVVAAGKGELVELFDRDPSRSPYSTPQRSLAILYSHSLRPPEGYPDIGAVSLNVIPGVGEFYVIPGLTLTGSCDMLLVEGVPGGPFDCFAGVSTPEEHLRLTLECAREYVPWEYERCSEAVPTDQQGTLTGRYAPTVRYPVGRLPSGGAVLGMADVVVLNDPITGQGSNNASKGATSYLKSILEQGDGPFDTEFMQRTFERYWSYAQYPTAFTNMMLNPPPHALQALEAAGQYEEVATRLVNGFDDPSDFEEWFLHPDKTQSYLADVQARNDAP